MRWQPAIRTVPPYHDDPAYIGALAASVRAHIATLGWTPQVNFTSGPTLAGYDQVVTAGAAVNPSSVATATGADAIAIARQILGPFATKENVDAFNARLGTDKSLITQYLTSMRRVFTLSFGDSYATGSSVNKIIFPALFRSGKLALLAFVITIPVSIIAGILLFGEILRNSGLNWSPSPMFTGMTL